MTYECPKCKTKTDGPGYCYCRPSGVKMRANTGDAATKCSEEKHGEYGKTCYHKAARPDAPSPAPATPAEVHFFDRRAADALADEVAKLIDRRVIDSRSPAADALLDYRDGWDRGALGKTAAPPAPGETPAAPATAAPEEWRDTRTLAEMLDLMAKQGARDIDPRTSTIVRKWAEALRRFAAPPASPDFGAPGIGCPSCGKATMEEETLYRCPACGDDYTGRLAAMVIDAHTVALLAAVDALRRERDEARSALAEARGTR